MKDVITQKGIKSLEFSQKRLDFSPENGIFEISFITNRRKRQKINSAMYKNFRTENDSYVFEDAAVFDGRISVFVKDASPCAKAFRIKIENNGDDIIEYINFPIVSAACNMVSSNGEDTLFWPRWREL